jgi:hypothetical protein
MDHYDAIPDYPDNYSAGTVLGRLIDGLGFRYHWATEGLTERELEYRPSESSRSLFETLAHVHSLVGMVASVLSGERYALPESAETRSLEELRRATLERIKQLSVRLKATSTDQFADMSLRFKRGDRDLDFPFWYVINGPMADALCHVGQVVSYRRAAGNPIDRHVKVLLGKRLDSPR